MSPAVMNRANCAATKAYTAFYSDLKDEDYYMSNLLKTGKLEGTKREVIGLLPEATDRTPLKCESS